MTKTSKGGILAIVIGAVMVIPVISSASPIHIAPQWPGGGLNGSEAARNARQDAHADQRASRTGPSEEAESAETLFDVVFDDLEGTPTPSITRSLDQLDGTLPGLSQVPPIFEPGVPNPFGAQLPEAALNLPPAAELTAAANPTAVTTVPEPGSFLLLGSGIVGAMAKARRRQLPR